MSAENEALFDDVELYPLPDSWSWVPLKEIASHRSGIAFKSGDFVRQGIQVVRLGNVYQGKLDLKRDPVFLPESFLEESFLLTSGNLVVSQTGTRNKRDYGNFVLIPEKTPKLFLNQRLLAVFCNQHIEPQYILFASKTDVYREHFFSCETGGVNQGNVGVKGVMDGPIPLPPLSEQRRIVAKIEGLTARSRKAREALDAIPPLLDQFRQSVLAAAFRGDLTADWRAANPDVEPAEKLLERIRVERRDRWEKAELEKMKTKGAVPKDDKWKEKYKSPRLPDDVDFQEIPERWCFATVEEIVSDMPRSLQSGPFGSNLKHSEFQGSGILAIGIDNVLHGEFSMGSENRISHEKYEELKKYTARPLDVLITVMATVGRCCVVPSNAETAIITKHVYRASPDQELINSYFFMNALRGSQIVLDQIEKNIRGQTRPGINGQILRSLVLPVPSKAEQEIILAVIQEKMRSIEDLESLLKVLGDSVDQLDQSILAQAFRGELVPQDPNDEPASVLLDRIRGEREKAQKPEKAGKGKKKS